MHSERVISPELLNAHARDAKHDLSFATLRNCRGPSDPLRSLIILPVPQPMSSTVYNLHSLQTVIHRRSGRRLGDRFRERLRDVEKDDKNASKPVAAQSF